MKIPLKDFPHQPQQMACCSECHGMSTKDCIPDPLHCSDFYIQNMDFIEERLATESEAAEIEQKTT